MDDTKRYVTHLVANVTDQGIQTLNSQFCIKKEELEMLYYAVLNGQYN